MSPVERAISQLGGVTATARAVGVKTPSVIKWRALGRIPAGRAMVVHRLTAIPLADLLAERAISAPDAPQTVDA